MRTIFDMGLARSPWDGLGQLPDMETAPEREERERREAAVTPPWWQTLITTGLTAGSEAFEAYTEAEIAEEKAEAKEAEAEAARARAEAERAKAAAIQAKSITEGAGIPTGYLVVGGLGLVGAVVAAVLLAR